MQDGVILRVYLVCYRVRITGVWRMRVWVDGKLILGNGVVLGDAPLRDKSCEIGDMV